MFVAYYFIEEASTNGHFKIYMVIAYRFRLKNKCCMVNRKQTKLNLSL